MLLVFDVGGTFIKCALVKNLKVMKYTKVPTPQDSFEEFLEAIENLKDSFSEEPIGGLAFSLPGTIDLEKGFIKQGGSLRYNDQRYFKDELEAKFSLPVSIENDARCAALAEGQLGHLKGISDGIVLVVGTGLGGAVIHKGKLIKGAHNYSGELSFMLTDNLRKEGMNALLGNKIGMKAFLEKAQKALEIPKLTGEEFMSLVKEKEPKAYELFDVYMDSFSQAMFSLQMLFDPERFVIGGGISEDSYFVTKLAEKFNELFSLFPIDITTADVKACKFGNQSNILGAAINHEMK